MQAQVFVEELTSIYDNVVPCFPPSYKIFTVVFRQYHKQIDDVLYSIGCCTSSLANNDILKVKLSWLSLLVQHGWSSGLCSQYVSGNQARHSMPPGDKAYSWPCKSPL